MSLLVHFVESQQWGRRSGNASRASHIPPADTTDLVVLAEVLVADPWVVRELHSCGIAHLPVRLRDGARLVGPLAVLGVTSCLGNY